MRNETANGARTLLSRTAPVKPKKSRKNLPAQKTNRRAPTAPKPVNKPAAQESLLSCCRAASPIAVGLSLLREGLKRDGLYFGEHALHADLAILVEDGALLQRSRDRYQVPSPHAAPRTIADWVFDGRKWPRYYELPGLASHRSHTAEEMMAYVCGVLHDFEDDLHEMVARHARKRPFDAAQLAEVLAIVEQTVCAEGLATELDTISIKEVSPRLRLAALARVQTLNKGKGGQD